MTVSEHETATLMDSDSVFWKIFVGLVVTVIGGVAIWWLTTASESPLVSATDVPTTPRAAENVIIDYTMVGGPFVIIGPNPGGEFARSGYYWNLIDIAVENNCSERIYVDRSAFRLYVSDDTDPSGDTALTPTLRGDNEPQYTDNRIRSGWVEPGDAVTGVLIFEVENLNSSGGRDSRYRILRYVDSLPCTVIYR